MTTIGVPAARRLDPDRAIFAAMAFGTIILLVGLLFVMAREPFEHVDDLIWLNKVSRENFRDIPFTSAWMEGSPFYRPGAELTIKLLYSVCGFNLLAYRVVQLGTVLLLLWVSRLVLRQLHVRPEGILLLGVFLIGSPFVSGSIVWLSELPHIIVLICFGLGVAALLSDRSDAYKLAICATMLALALSMKENGLALLIFYPFLMRARPVGATLAFGTITLGYILLRATILGGGMGMANASPVDYQLYALNVASQLIALWTRLTKWGAPITEFRLETILQIVSTAIIAVAVPFWRKTRIGLLLLTVALGCAIFSYAYARDRHLALPAYAYGLLFIISTNALSQRWPRLLLCAWLAWSLQAAITLRDVHRASVDLIEKVYRPNLAPLVAVPTETWTAARSAALNTRP